MSPIDGSLQDDRNRYEDGPKRSSGAKDMTILEMLVLALDQRMELNLINMAADEKFFNIKVLCLVETDDFYIQIVLI